MSRIWTVHGYERTIIMMCVEAATEKEAIEKAQRGDYSEVDSEPGPRLLSPKWTASEGWHSGFGRRRP